MYFYRYNHTFTFNTETEHFTISMMRINFIKKPSGLRFQGKVASFYNYSRIVWNRCVQCERAAVLQADVLGRFIPCCLSGQYSGELLSDKRMGRLWEGGLEIKQCSFRMCFLSPAEPNLYSPT